MHDGHPVEIREFKLLRQEVDEAIEARDATTATVALGEIEGIWMHSESLAMRKQAAAVMRQHAAYGEFVEFVA